jgi:hypothetical protein
MIRLTPTLIQNSKKAIVIFSVYCLNAFVNWFCYNAKRKSVAVSGCKKIWVEFAVEMERGGMAWANRSPIRRKAAMRKPAC